MFTLQPLPYNYDALEPFISEATMKVHYDKHHRTYCDKFNALIENYPELYGKLAETMVAEINNLPEAIRVGVHNFGGGYINHSFFWSIMCPAPESGAPEGLLAEAIKNTFGDLEKFKLAFKDKALALFGSGWTWLVTDESKKLEIINLPNQDSPLAIGKKPLLALDLWEHAYYLQYQSRRIEYIDAWFNVINWGKVGELYG